QDPAPGARASTGARRPMPALASTTLLALIASSDIAAAASPAKAVASASVSLSVVLIAAVCTIVVIAVTVGAYLLHQRAGRAGEEPRRLTSLFDVLAEGILVCNCMQVLAANTSVCRLAGIAAKDAPDLMIGSFLPDADVIDRLLSDNA